MMIHSTKLIIADDLVVDGETYGCVKSFCYLGDALDGDGGVDFAITFIRHYYFSLFNGVKQGGVISPILQFS